LITFAEIRTSEAHPGTVTFRPSMIAADAPGDRQPQVTILKWPTKIHGPTPAVPGQLAGSRTLLAGPTLAPIPSTRTEATVTSSEVQALSAPPRRSASKKAQQSAQRPAALPARKRVPRSPKPNDGRRATIRPLREDETVFPRQPSRRGLAEPRPDSGGSLWHCGVVRRIDQHLGHMRQPSRRSTEAYRAFSPSGTSAPAPHRHRRPYPSDLPVIAILGLGHGPGHALSGDRRRRRHRPSTAHRRQQEGVYTLNVRSIYDAQLVGLLRVA
jgi:hypothetical protein